MGVPLSDGPRTIIVAPPGGAGSTDICAELEVTPMPVVPTVGLLVDNSSSMFQPREELWDTLYSTLMDPATGVVQALQDKVRFGFASYKGFAASSEDDPACAEMTTVPYDLNNYEAIDAVYTALGAEYTGQQTWETPTGYAVNFMATDLAAYMPDPPGPKYILMVTDGDPNTCTVVNPQCGQDAAIRAVQDAYAMGVGTFVIGIGDIVSNNSGCNVDQARCGPDHLQDIANAGLGLPVQDPPDDYIYQPCIAGQGQGGAGVLLATYASATGDTPGTAPFYAAGNGDELQAAIEELLNAVLSCTFDMDAIVTGNAALGIVSVGGTELGYEDPNGWTLEDNRYQVTLLGSACDAFQTGEQQLSITFPCDPSGEPVAVRR